MEDFLSNYQKYIDIATNLIFVVLSILLFFKTKNTKYLTEIIEKLEKKNVTVGQSFEKLVPVYRLNKGTNVLEKTEDYIDIQELVNSSAEYALDRVLNRLMPVDTPVEELQQTVDIMQDNLDIMANLIERANVYRVEQGLDPALSVEEVYRHMQKNASDLKIKLTETEDLIKKQKEIKKEVLDNEKI